MLLKKAIVEIQASNQVAVYAIDPTNPDSDSRIGQTQFENGSLLDNMSFVIDGEMANREVMAFTEDEPELIEEHDLYDQLFDYIQDNR